MLPTAAMSTAPPSSPASLCVEFIVRVNPASSAEIAEPPRLTLPAAVPSVPLERFNVSVSETTTSPSPVNVSEDDVPVALSDNWIPPCSVVTPGSLPSPVSVVITSSVLT